MSKLVLLVILLSVVQSAVSIKFHIVLSLNNQCPGELAGEPCLTLQQYVSYPSPSSNITLEMEPGNHELISNFQISNRMYFGLIAPADATIECSGQTSVQVSFSSVTQVDINGVTFIRCRQVSLQSSMNVSVIRSNFFNTLGSYSLYFSSSNAIIESCTFANNTGSRSIYLSSSSAVITQTSFKNNTENTYGTAIYFTTSTSLQRYLTVERCSFTNNTANYRGGAVYVRDSYGSVSFISSRNIFKNNRVIYNYGGAIYVTGSTNTGVKITESTFFNNTSGYLGGAVYLTGSNGVSSNGNSFINNTATRSGGALYISGTSIDNGNRFTNNRANDGGAVYASGSITSSGSNFSNNTANNNGGAIFVSGSYISSNGSNFVNNRARRGGGGAIYTTSYRVSVTTHDSTFINNVGTSGGGALYIPGSRASLTVNSTIFVNNLINGPNGNGGAVNVASANAQQIVFSNSIFVNNSATNGSGGAVYTKRGISIIDTIFGQNRAPLCAAFNVEQSNSLRSMSLTTSTFLHNTAVGSTVRGNLGGVGCIRNAEILISRCTFSHNSAAGGGGVLDIEDSIVNIESSTFKNNTAGIDGGVFYTHAFPSNYTINDSRFINNRAVDDGGVLYMGRSGSFAELFRNSFMNNVATDRGGAVALFGSSMTMIDTNMQNNMADKGGDISACNSNRANVIPSSLNAQIDLLYPVCMLYDGSIQHYPEPQSHDNSNFDIMPYFHTFIHGLEEPPSTTTVFSSTTGMEVDPILLEIRSRLFGTSVITYLLFTFAIIFAVILIIAIALKCKQILKKRRMNKIPPNTENEVSESIELYEEPDWSIQQHSNPTPSKHSTRFTKQQHHFKK